MTPKKKSVEGKPENMSWYDFLATKEGQKYFGWLSPKDRKK